MFKSPEVKITWEKSQYYLSDDEATGNMYIRNRGDATNTEISIANDELNTLLSDLMGIDRGKPDDFLKFCNKYGRLGIAHFSQYEHGYPLISLHTEGKGQQAPETIKSYIIFTRIIESLLVLQDAIQEKDYGRICYITMYLLSTFEGFSAVPDALFDLENEILNECRKFMTWPEPLGVDIEKIYEPGSRYTFDFEPWVTEELQFIEKDFNWNTFILQWSQVQLEELLYYSQRLAARMISKNIASIKFTLGVAPSGQLQDSLSADSLSSIIYYILYLKISRGTIMRVCANKTCRKVFEIAGNDTRKIYCRAECAKLEAKRMQRAREKQGNNKKRGSRT